MPLPELIEIVPTKGPVVARVSIPGSKSITNRALVLAALANGETVLTGALWSEDTQVMVECLRELGFEVSVQPDPGEESNRIISVHGLGGNIPKAGTREQPLNLFVGNAGTAARFLAALVCLGDGFYCLHGIPRMHARPQEDLFLALRQLGYDVESATNKLPVVIRGSGPREAECAVSIQSSSQFASALLLCSGVGRWTVKVVGENADESPYVLMTSRLMEVFPRNGGTLAIEPDSSSGSYFIALGWMLAHHEAALNSQSEASGEPQVVSYSNLEVANWPVSDWQIDSAFPKFLPLPFRVSRLKDLGDSIMTAIVLAAHNESSWMSMEPLKEGDIPGFEGEKDFSCIIFQDLGRLRVQECERVQALRMELAKCGAAVMEVDDFLVISPSQLRGATIETYNDHRMAMCFSMLGLLIPGMRIRNPACVKKTFPTFFQKLAKAPPLGLGAVILDVATGKPLDGMDLFAG